MMRRYKTVEKVRVSLRGTDGQILQTVRLEGILKVPDTYQDDFTLAELAFVHQRVYDPRTQRMVPLLDLPETGLGARELGYIGL
jgi:exonuclease-1